ncbi:MAG: glycosyltransferase [Dehalobacter sp.]|nr:glycosyltransferase [Dehalobacter sp.]
MEGEKEVSGILIFSSNYGEGHFQAGEALTEAFCRQPSPIEVKHLDFGSFFYFNTDYLMRKAYATMIKKTPKLWRMLFEKTAGLTAEDCRKFVRGLETKKLLDCIWKFNPDVIVSTHFIPAAILGELKLKGLLSVPLVTVVTDYLVHGVWIHSGTDKYIVGCKDACAKLVEAGIAPRNVIQSGIPLRLRFEESMQKNVAKQKLRLDLDQKTVLIMGLNGKPVINVAELKNIVRNLAQDIQAQLLVVCGYNKELYHALNNEIRKTDLRVRLYGHVDNVQELMAASDLMITKGGALTISEALTMGLPLLMYRPIPGHEKGNAYFVEQAGAGKAFAAPDELIHYTAELFKYSDRLETMRSAARMMLPVNPSQNAAAYILTLRKSTKTNPFKTEAI